MARERGTTQHYRELQAESPFKIVSEVDFDKLEKIKLHKLLRPGGLQKEYTYRHDFPSIETAIYCWMDFWRLASEVWHLQGAELFEQFRKTIKGHAISAWDRACAGKPLSNEGFFEALLLLFQEKFGTGSFDRFQEFFPHIVKPNRMEVQNFFNRLEQMVAMSKWLVKSNGQFPAATDLFTTNQIKHYFTRAMPTAWYSLWQDHPTYSSNEDNISVQTIIQFFERQSHKEAAKARLISTLPQRGRPSSGGRYNHGRTPIAGRGFYRSTSAGRQHNGFIPHRQHYQPYQPQYQYRPQQPSYRPPFRPPVSSYSGGATSSSPSSRFSGRYSGRSQPSSRGSFFGRGRNDNGRGQQNSYIQPQLPAQQFYNQPIELFYQEPQYFSTATSTIQHPQEQYPPESAYADAFVHVENTTLNTEPESEMAAAETQEVFAYDEQATFDEQNALYGDYQQQYDY